MVESLEQIAVGEVYVEVHPAEPFSSSSNFAHVCVSFVHLQECEVLQNMFCDPVSVPWVERPVERPKKTLRRRGEMQNYVSFFRIRYLIDVMTAETDHSSGSQSAIRNCH